MPSQATPSVPPPGTLTAAQLKGTLPTPPAGAKPDSPNSLNPSSILSLDQFVNGIFTAKSVTAERKALTAEGFKYAAETNWDAKNGTGAEIFLVELGTPASAQDYVSSVSAGIASSTLPSTLAHVPGGKVLTATSVDTYGDIIMEAWFHVGNVAVDLHYYSHAKADTAGLNALALAQYTRLTKSMSGA